MSYFKYGKINLYYEERGNLSSEKVVVFLNGVMASTNSWVNQISLFEKLDFRIVLHDFKGQLLSDKPSGPYTFSEHAEETKALLEHLKIDRAHFIGTSYGGEVALKFAMIYQEMVETIAVINSVTQLDEVLKFFIKGWKALAEAKDPENFFYGMIPTIYHNTYIENNLDLIKNRANTFNHLPGDYFTGQIELYKTFEQDVTMTDSLHLITSPTIIICGENDILKPKKFSKIIADNIKNSEYITIPDCGHVTIFEKPKELNSILAGFILKNLL